MLWGLAPLQHQSANDVAVDFLRGQIHSGLLVPEEKLPAERKLSEDIGIARTTLREALRVLEADGYLQVKRGAHGGTFVIGAEPLNALARRRIARNPARAMRTLEFITLNERAAAEYAAQRHTPSEVKRMEFAINLLTQATSPADRKQARTYFHLALADAAQNPILGDSLHKAHAQLFLPASASTDPDRIPVEIDAYASVLAAVRSRDTDRAAQAIQPIHDLSWARLRAITSPASI